VTLSIALPTRGTGAHLVLRQVVAEVLAVLDEVEIGSRTPTTSRLTLAWRKPGHAHRGPRRVSAAEKLKAQIEAEATKHGNSAGRAGHDRRAAAKDGRTLEASHFYEREGSRGRHLLHGAGREVAVDPATGQVTVRHFTTAHDVGTIINPIGHQGQIEGGLIHGLASRSSRR